MCALADASIRMGMASVGCPAAEDEHCSSLQSRRRSERAAWPGGTSAGRSLPSAGAVQDCIAVHCKSRGKLAKALEEGSCGELPWSNIECEFCDTELCVPLTY